MTSSVDPTLELIAIKARLDALDAPCIEGAEAGHKFEVDGWGKKVPYRDLEGGSVIRAARGRLMSAGEQSQPHVFSFQVHHAAPTRREAWLLGVETDKTLIGWNPSANAGPIDMFFFTMYDEFAKDGERLAWIATRFYETTLGMNPDSALDLEQGYGNGGYGQ